MELKDFLNQIESIARSYGNSINIRAAKQYLNERTIDLFGVCLWYCSECNDSGAFVYEKAETATATWKKIKLDHHDPARTGEPGTSCNSANIRILKPNKWKDRL